MSDVRPIVCPGLIRGTTRIPCGSTDLRRIKGPVTRHASERRAGKERNRCLLACQSCGRYVWTGASGAADVPMLDAPRPAVLAPVAAPTPSSRPGEAD